MNKKEKSKIIFLSGLITLLIILCIYAFSGFAPFGTKTLAVMDANIQYIDFFSYLKSVIAGKNSITYSFGKTLGGSNVAVFSYYLSSPFNLLLLFFSNANLYTFFNIVVALKLTLASIAFAYFITNRFEASYKDNSILFILLSCGYGLCQYSFFQASNIMWLDGMYMLPFMLLQVYYIVQGKKNWNLSIAVGLAIIFNWYIAGISCVFTGIWFLLECCLYAVENKMTFIQFIKTGIRYVFAMILGVMVSAVLFLPTIGALTNGPRGSLSLRDILDFSFVGNMLSVIPKYSYGADSMLGYPALFCGGLAIVLALSVFFNSRIKVKVRTVLGIFLVGIILCLYWHPLYLVFSLFKSVTSYNYRYSFLIEFFILFLAAYNCVYTKEKNNIMKTGVVAIVFSVLNIVLTRHYTHQEKIYAYLTVSMIIVLTSLYISSQLITKQKTKQILLVVLLIAGSIDLGINSTLLANSLSMDILNYKSYRKNQEKIINNIKIDDNSNYRITQTSNRTTYECNLNNDYDMQTKNMFGLYEGNLTANYDEPLSYGYKSTSGYTSSPDGTQLDFLNKCGYPTYADCLTVTNTSMLGIDSLLGVKYVLTSENYTGLVKKNNTKLNGKYTYTNPYYMPLAFTCTNFDAIKYEEGYLNPFDYQNLLFKQLFNTSKDIYKPVKYSVTKKDDSNTEINLNTSNYKNMVYYGSIPWTSGSQSYVYNGKDMITKYACWLSPTVFHIETDNSNTKLRVESADSNFNYDNAQFYALNLSVLDECAKTARKNEVNISMKNGAIDTTVKAEDKDSYLYLSVPVDDCWDVLVNNEKAEVKSFGDCLYAIKLHSGTNKITMRYHTKHQKLGIGLTAGAILFIIVSAIYRKKYCKEN